jgi:hypothetical protein
MIVEVVFEKHHPPSPQRRPTGHVRPRSTKKGNKKRGLRSRLVNLLDEETESEDEDEEDVLPLRDGGPPAMNDRRSV